MNVKTELCFLVSNIRIRIRRAISRLPHRLRRRLRALGAPILGGIIGLIGGIPGFLIGLLLGYLLGELFVQFGRDRRILGYFENPGVQRFYEGEPGLAAWCALGVLVASQSQDDCPESSAAEIILKEVVLGASHVFSGPQIDLFLAEHFSRLALSCKDRLNPDLLAESLAARRTPKGRPAEIQEDLENLGRGLKNLAAGEKARALARQIRLILEPDLKDEEEGETYDSGKNGTITKDPWKILGLPPGTPLREVKAHYRRLAKQFHPDEMVLLDEKHRETAARAFMTIQEAYKEISEQ